MTPLQFAREECANHQPDGSCLGAWINEDLSITRGEPPVIDMVPDTAETLPATASAPAPTGDTP